MKQKEKQVYWVDIPKMPGMDTEDQEYQNVATFKTKEAAIKFCIEKFGADKNGNICLITPS